MASSEDKGGWSWETGAHCICARERAEELGIKILCSVLTFPWTLSAKLLSISAGKGSLAPKSPSKSICLPSARILSGVRRAVVKGKELWGLCDGVFLERERSGESERCGTAAEPMGWEGRGMKA